MRAVVCPAAVLPAVLPWFKQKTGDKGIPHSLTLPAIPLFSPDSVQLTNE